MYIISKLKFLIKQTIDKHHPKRYAEGINRKIILLKETLTPMLLPKLGNLYHHEPKSIYIPKRYHKKKLLKNPPLISIVTPSFNQGHFLERTIQSILKQQYSHLEYIIQDGGSCDETLQILKQHSTKLKHWESKCDAGQSNAINLGLRHATGEIMAYLNSDDILLPGSLHYIAHYFAKHPKVDVVYGHRILIDENDHEIGRWTLPPHDFHVLSWADYIPQETLFWRRRIWDKVGGTIDESFRFAMDWDLILRFRDAGAKFVRLPRFLGAFRVHMRQKTSSEMSRIGMEEMQRIRSSIHGRDVNHEEIMKQIRFYLFHGLVYHRLYKAGILRY